MDVTISTEADSYVKSRNVSEYLFVVAPDNELTRGLQDFQAKLVKCYNYFVEPLPIRHIALASLVAKDSVEVIISSWIRKACITQAAFDIHFYPDCVFNQGVMFLELNISEALQALNAQLHVIDDFLQASGCSPLQVLSTPHLPIGIISDHRAMNVDPVRIPRFRSPLQIKEIAMLKRHEADQPFEKANVFGLSK